MLLTKGDDKLQPLETIIRRYCGSFSEIHTDLCRRYSRLAVEVSFQDLMATYNKTFRDPEACLQSDNTEETRRS